MLAKANGSVYGLTAAIVANDLNNAVEQCTGASRCAP
jgi:acyl-CoA reductase-like NAD-dependent aldehyde dehydrogenase